jgi:hypothetical protein
MIVHVKQSFADATYCHFKSDVRKKKSLDAGHTVTNRIFVVA